MKQTRIIKNDISLRSEGEGQDYIEGYGIVFNKDSVVMRTMSGKKFIERIERSAINDEKLNDVLGLLNHDINLVLGRTSSGTMKLTVDDIGVRYSIQVPNTTAGRDAVEYAKRNDLAGSSFSFSDAKDRVEKRSDGVYLRTITDLSPIYDIGPVFSPAYRDTTSQVEARSIDEYKEEIEEIGIKSTDKIKLKLKLNQ